MKQRRTRCTFRAPPRDVSTARTRSQAASNRLDSLAGCMQTVPDCRPKKSCTARFQQQREQRGKGYEFTAGSWCKIRTYRTVAHSGDQPRCSRQHGACIELLLAALSIFGSGRSGGNISILCETATFSGCRVASAGCFWLLWGAASATMRLSPKRGEQDPTLAFGCCRHGFHLISAGNGEPCSRPVGAMICSSVRRS